MSDPIQCPECGASLPELVPGGLCPRCTLGAVFGDPQKNTDRNFEAPEINGLTVHEEVGEGGFGIVYRATQTGTIQRLVALKVLKPGVDTRQVIRRFEIEQQALALMEHANIARIYETGQTKAGYPWFTMEYIEGLPISEAFAGASLTEMIEGFLPVCGAVSYAHTKGILHRDLKPSNILVSSEGVPKVIDFGVAKSLDSSASPGMTAYTGGQGFLGTAAYMAPEQADSSGIDLDERVDIYSLGAVLYELVTGVNPQDAQGKNDAIPIPSLMALREIPLSLERVILKALKKDREFRYSTVGEFTADLRRVLNGDRISLAKIRSRKTWIWGLVATLGVSALLVFWNSKEEVSEIGERKTELKSLFRYPGRGHPHYFRIHAEKGILFAFYRGTSVSSVIDLETGDLISTIKHEHAFSRSSHFSIDGREILIGFLNGAMRRFDTRTGKPSTAFQQARITKERYPCDFVFEFEEEGEPLVATVSDQMIMSVRKRDGTIVRTRKTGHYRSCISKDQRTIIFGSHKGPLAFWRIGENVKYLEGHGPRFYDIIESDDGAFFASADHDGKIGVWNQEGKNVHFFEHPLPCQGLAFSPDGKLLATGCHDGWIRLWDLSTGKIISRFEHGDRLLALDFSPDGNYLVSGALDSGIHFWDLSKGKLVGEERDLNGGIFRLLFHRQKSGRLMLAAMTGESGVIYQEFSRILDEVSQ